MIHSDHMNEIASSFGTHAGVVWRTLHQYGPLSESVLIERTHLSSYQLFIAIGWLARENKIRKEDDLYKLGETNLLPIVGKDAGKLWRALDIWGEVDNVSLSRLARISEDDVFCAVGWLAREGKIDASIRDADEKKILFWLK
jgi:hypothetical protein